MTTKHTPGPWRVSTPYLVQTASEHICEAAHKRLPGGDDEAKANAQLIAASPELLAALENAAACLMHAKDRTPGMHDTYQAAEHEARAAIAKAKGEA